MTKNAINSLWGDFEELEDGEEITKTETETDQDDDDGDDSSTKAADLDADEDEGNLPPDSQKGGKSDSPKEKEKSADDDDDPMVSAFDAVTEGLETADLLFIDEDKTYEPTIAGFKEMMKDNITAYKTRMEKEFVDREKAIRDEYENAGVESVMDLNPNDDADAEKMLLQYYKEIGLDQDEIKENLRDIKNLDTLAKEARIAQRFLGKKEKEQREAAAKAEEDAKIAKVKEVEDYISGVKTYIDEAEELAGFQMTPKIKKGFKEYLFKKDAQGVSEAQKASKDPLRRIKLAFLDYMDYSKNDFEIKIKSDLAKNYAKKVSRFTSTSAQSKGITIKQQENKEGLQPGFTDFWSPAE